MTPSNLVDKLDPEVEQPPDRTFMVKRSLSMLGEYLINVIRRSTRPRGRAVLPIVELEAAKVRQKGTIRPLPESSEDLQVSAWALYHAAKKAEFLRTFTRTDADQATWSFAADHQSFFRWTNEELRLVPGAATAYEGASHNHRANRIGEGCLLLLMQKRGYAYWDRLDVLIERAARNQAIRHSKSVKQSRVIKKELKEIQQGKRPDFVLETGSGATALAEAKGSLLAPGGSSTIKPDLRKALEQLDACKRLISPRPKRSYAVGTYLREVDDSSKEGSLIAVVDPVEPDDGSDSLEIPRDWIRRATYGAWLVGMGFDVAGNHLRTGSIHSVRQYPLPVLRIGGAEYAIIPDWLPQIAGLPQIPHSVLDSWWYPGRLLFPAGEESEIPVIGIRVDILNEISRALVSPREESLLRIEPALFGESGGFDGSVMPDGSIYGAVAARDLLELESQTFEL